ncbi:low molecular weight protein-tyrosine-phosphatase [Lactobacillus sp. YT155]|uniref:low molecular weight protein-tyrosine-phosphatase n=1 Tax=Lactobacillus sp. YT155 TaxID=3060955 RepID=UPI00265D8344|nr:low molecular weight protein-tyrosine-phosphatase [Lactobacillus sp. YT155]MDO1605331.1 low molecular weight protein-tyrosine-phosphatase [Lactobacillus sp. YT155]
MKSILFVCLGNICRSPMAEMMMKDLVNNKNLENEIKVNSKATSTYEIGNSPHPLAIQKLKEKKVPTINHTAQQITENDYKEYDYILGMDEQNIIDLKQMAPDSETEAKIYLATSVLEKPYSIKDPWYDENFERTYNDLVGILPIWLEKMTK